MSVEQLNRQLEWSKKQTSYAWAKYYESEREALGDNIAQYERVNGVMIDEAGLPDFVKIEMMEMIKELKKKIECPICLEVIEVDHLDISKCGHKYCKDCLGRLKQSTKKCAVCRKKLCK